MLAHLQLPSGITEQSVIFNEMIPVATLDNSDAAIELELIPATAPALLPEKKSGTNRSQGKFRSLSKVNILSAENVHNRSFHQQLESSEQMVLAEHVQFSFDDFELKNNADFNKILSMADELIFNPHLKISLSGNTDSVGEDNYNDILSYNRVANVRAYLLELGVQEKQITLSFNGEHNPVAENATEAGRAENRRVEIFLYQ